MDCRGDLILAGSSPEINNDLENHRRCRAVRRNFIAMPLVEAQGLVKRLRGAQDERAEMVAEVERVGAGIILRYCSSKQLSEPLPILQMHRHRPVAQIEQMRFEDSSNPYRFGHHLDRKWTY